MLLGALVDAGVDPALLMQTVEALNLGVTVTFAETDRSGIHARRARVLVGGREADAPAGQNMPSVHTHALADQHPVADEPADAHAHQTSHPHVHGRSLTAIRALLQAAPLPKAARDLALRAFTLLGEAEAAIHHVPLDQIHFHEVGAVDAIVDIACAAAGLTSLGVERWYCSPVNVGSGFVECAHGRYPVPAPATAALLRGVPTYSEGPAMELVTPTGAALLRALDCTFARPAAAFHRIGYGAGTRNPPRFPNVLRLNLGDAGPDAVHDAAAPIARESIAVLECAVDDLSPQVVAHAAQLILEQGALDVMTAPVTMKKGRLGTRMTVLCHPADLPQLEALLFRETSTLGIRHRIEQRRTLERHHVTVATAYGQVRIKTASMDGGVTHAQPEYDDCHRLALAHRVPLKKVLDAALAAWRELNPESDRHPQETPTP